jgi:hypothetical protein
MRARHSRGAALARGSREKPWAMQLHEPGVNESKGHE